MVNREASYSSGVTPRKLAGPDWPLFVGKGARYGESGDLADFLRWRLEAV